MDRIQALISKLKEQAEQKASTGQMLVTVQLIQNEILKEEQSVKVMGTSKVAVFMPAPSPIDMSQYKEYLPKEEIVSHTATVDVEEKPAVVEKQAPPAKKANQLDMDFDPLTEIPTLSQQKVEGNNRPLDNISSINDRLRSEKSELGDRLKDSPVKDLRKAIGINDRFVFINDLFRGDEAMYERSIKTINSFNIYAEAEYWITRELKIKLGWNPENSVVVQFDKLVKRRFS